MAKAKKTAATRARPMKPSDETIEAIHAVFVGTNRDPNDDNPARLLASIAQQFGAHFSDVRARAEGSGGWYLERDARLAGKWLREVWPGVTNETEFCLQFAVRMHLITLTGGSAEAIAFVLADARDTWRRAMAPAEQWQAHRDAEHARAAYNAKKQAAYEAATRIVGGEVRS